MSLAKCLPTVYATRFTAQNKSQQLYLWLVSCENIIMRENAESSEPNKGIYILSSVCFLF